MSVNLIESIRGFFNNQFVNKTSSFLGENNSAVQKALGGIIPALLGGALARVNAGDAGGVLNMARNTLGSGGPAGMLSGDTGSLLSRGTHLVTGLLGTKTSAVSNAIARYAGIKEASASSLMSISAPLALGRLGEHAQQNNMDAAGFGSFLAGQKEHILNAMPPGLNLGSLLGLGSLASLGGKAAGLAGDSRKRLTTGTQMAGNWAWTLALLLLVVVAVWYFVARNRNQPAVATTTLQDTSTAFGKQPSATTPRVLGKMTTRVRLANGVELEAYAGGVEEKLVICLNDASCMAGRDKWFDFDNINFETGSARLTAESLAQVRNIVAVLNAYPNARIKIGGYTDKTGNAEANKKLSQQRAEAVMNAIKDAGGNARQLAGAQGYGSAMAKVPAEASDEERRADRRISVQLQAK